MNAKIPNSKWIWVPDWEQRYQTNKAVIAEFRKVLVLRAGDIRRAEAEGVRVRISADTRYKLYVNGIFAEAGPSKGDDKERFYDEPDLYPYLREGENVIAVEVLHYPPVGTEGNYSLFSSGKPGLYVEEAKPGDPEPIDETWTEIAVSEDADASCLHITADSSWKVKIREHFEICAEESGYAPLHIFEKYQADGKDAFWKEPGFDDSSWENARPYTVFEIGRADAPGNIEKRTIPFLYRKKKNFAAVSALRETTGPGEDGWNQLLAGKAQVTIPAGGREIVEIDASCEETGYVALSLAGGKDAKIRITYAESYTYPNPKKNGFNDVPLKGDRMDSRRGRIAGYSDYYCAAGYGTRNRPEVYSPFWIRCFRYIRLEIETGDEPLTVCSLDYEETGYPLDVKTEVKTSDPSLVPVWDISVRSLRRCMQETYTDCPYYEQLQYAMDSRSQILYTYMVSADDRLARKCMRDFRKSQRYDGMINCDYPCTVPNIIPGFAIYYILMIHDHMMFFGDREFLREFTGCIDGILHFFGSRLDQRGLVSKIGGANMDSRYWSFIDWTKEWDPLCGVPTASEKGPITMESMLYILGLEAAADIVSFIGRKDTAGEYRSRAQAVRNAVRSCCIGENGMIMDGPGVRDYSQHCQVFGILSGVTDREQGRKNLMETLDHPEEYAQCSIAMAIYLFKAMRLTGLYERTDEKWNLWRNMVKNHVTTCVENDTSERSDCHAWGALALYELPAVTLGVRPAAPGFRKAVISPIPGYMTSAEGHVATPLGYVDVSWKLNNGKLDLHYHLPEGMELSKEDPEFLQRT